MKITFEGDVSAVLGDMHVFLQAVGKFPAVGEQSNTVAKEVSDEAEVPEAKSETATTVRDRRANRNRNDNQPTTEDGDAVASRGPRRASAPAKKSAPADKATKKLTDVALTQHASTAAETLTPRRVKAILKGFKVKEVSELEGDDRQAFVDQLKDEVEKKSK